MVSRHPDFSLSPRGAAASESGSAALGAPPLGLLCPRPPLPAAHSPELQRQILALAGAELHVRGISVVCVSGFLVLRPIVRATHVPSFPALGRRLCAVVTRDE